MRKLFVDNWFMEQVASDEKLELEDRSDSYFEFLNALVLWDEIYYPDNDRTWWKELSRDLEGMVRPIELPSEYESMKLADHAEKAFRNIDCDDHTLFDLQVKNKLQELEKSTTSIISNEALGYFWVSKENDCDYLPHSKRKRFIRQALPQVASLVKRTDVMSLIDKDIRQYYLTVFQEYELNRLQYEMPVLSRMIISNLPAGFSPIDYALHLKYEGHVERYRKYCSEMENYLKVGEFSNYAKMRENIKDVLNGAINHNKKASLTSISVGFLPTSSIGLGFNLPPRNKNYNLVFLNDLVSFARTNPPLIY